VIDIDKCPGCKSTDIYNSGFKIECPTTGCPYYTAKQELCVRPTVPEKKTSYAKTEHVDPYVDPVWPPSEPADRTRPGAFISRVTLKQGANLQAVYDDGLVVLEGRGYNDTRPSKTASSRRFKYTDTGWYNGLLIASVNEVTEAPEFHQAAGWWWCVRGCPDNSRIVDAGKVNSREEAIKKATHFSRVPDLDWRVEGEEDA
jgi:hypothetical protein